MIKTDVLVIGAGPAGLRAAIEAGKSGADVLVLERAAIAGGQLVKQTHMFFGSEKQYAAHRGFGISAILLGKLGEYKNIKLLTDATVLAAYDDGIYTAEINGKYEKIKPKAVVAATGASEKTLPFPGCDLPGIYGAGAVQTLMNQYGIKPANRVVMLGAGNIGLIVSYQLIQAGVEVLAVVEGGPRIGGYLVHASKLARLGVPIFTSHSVKEAHGRDELEAVTIWGLDENWQGILGTEQVFLADTLCVSVGLSPLTELLWQRGVKMRYIPALGGNVPIRDENLSTTVPGVFAAGDCAGIEEASSAMVEGALAGIAAAEFVFGAGNRASDAKAELLEQLEDLRRGEHSARLREGREMQVNA